MTTTNETNQAHWRDCNLPRDHRNICRHVEPIVDPVEAHRTGTCNDETCPSCEWWRTFEADLSEVEVAGATWLLPDHLADLGAFIARCREA